MTAIRNRLLKATLAAALLAVATPAALGAWPPYKPIEVKGNALTTARHSFTVADSGLPAQVVIQPAKYEIRLEQRLRGRGGGSAPGRGEQLRAPMRLVATIGGKDIDAEPTGKVKIAPGETGVTCTSQVKAGNVTADLAVTYQPDGAMLIDVAYSGGKVDRLALVIDVSGTVDIAYPGLPGSFDPAKAEFAKIDPSLPIEGELLWANDAQDGPAKGFVNYLYFGSLDRGFTWLCDKKDGFVLDDSAMVRITRNEAGEVTFSAYLVNHAANIGGKKTASFALLTHPSRFKPANFRSQQWLDWPAARLAGVDGVQNTTLAARAKLMAHSPKAKGLADLPGLGALTAFSLESVGSVLEMRGNACAKLLSVEKDLAAVYPMALFGVCSGTFTGLPGRVSPNVGEVVTPGEALAPSRNVLGRALLHDIGVDVTGLEQPAEFLRVVKILEDFGALKGDGLTEVIPYWRGKGLVRYGEVFNPADAFELTAEDPMARVHVTTYRRPVMKDGRHTGEYKALFVVVNESDEPVRDRLFILDQARVYGKRIALTAKSVWSQMPFETVESLATPCDWGEPTVTGRGSKMRALRDMEDNGAVAANRTRGRKGENFGPLFVPAHGMRILYGQGSRR